MKRHTLFAALFLLTLTASGAPVVWVDWISGTSGSSGSAAGELVIGPTTVDVTYTGEIAFIRTTVGSDYWAAPPGTYTSALVDNGPPSPDMIALSGATSKTLQFSDTIDNLFFAVMSLNGNGYEFNQDFEVVSFGPGYTGNGTLTRQDVGGGLYRLIGTGEPHGVIRFLGEFDSITWTSLTNEYWNAFTIGTYGLAPDPTTVPEPSGCGLAALALLAIPVLYRKRV